jgi:hypothetical protein
MFDFCKIRKLSRLGVAALLLFALTATPIMLGCGKKAPPKPPKEEVSSVLPR